MRGDRGMTRQVAIMYSVAAVLAGAGVTMLLALTKPRPEGQVYALRMAGVMALAGAAVLTIAATNFWRWGMGG